MAIFHRVLLKKRRNRQASKTTKTAYKKFLGLPTFKSVLYTNASTIKKAGLIKKPQLKVALKIKRKKRNIIDCISWKGVKPYSKMVELAAVSNDIEAFFNLRAEINQPTLPKVFVAFLPKAVWKKMSRADKQKHTQKRKAQNLQTKPATIPTFKFSSRDARPVLKGMSYSKRRCYLKGLVKIAISKKIDYLPFSPSAQQKLSASRRKGIIKKLKILPTKDVSNKPAF